MNQNESTSNRLAAPSDSESSRSPTVPSPWGEALKGILHIKQLRTRVGHVFGSPTTTLQRMEWAGQLSDHGMERRAAADHWIDQLIPQSGLRRRRV